MAVLATGLGADTAALTLRRIEPVEDDWRRMSAFPDHVVFQTREWLEFVARTQGAEPVVAEVREGRARVGYFVGLVVRRCGVRILGSPFPGWTTPTMGFVLEPGVCRREAVAGLVDLAFGPLHCLHLELGDRWLGEADVAGLGFETDRSSTLEVDLGGGEDAVLARMTRNGRWSVRRAERAGVTVEVASGPGFADEYHAQLRGVFARQGLVPTYDVERVRELIRRLEPADRLLLLRCRAPDGRCIATALYPALGRTAYFWGGASLREDQVLRPNEALFWFAARHWAARGVTALDLGGANDYKRKYGGREVASPTFRRSRLPGLSSLRGLAQVAASQLQQRRGARAAVRAGVVVDADRTRR